MASGILMECLQVSGVVEYPGDVQGGGTTSTTAMRRLGPRLP